MNLFIETPRQQAQRLSRERSSQSGARRGSLDVWGGMPAGGGAAVASAAVASADANSAPGDTSQLSRASLDARLFDGAAPRPREDVGYSGSAIGVGEMSGEARGRRGAPGPSARGGVSSFAQRMRGLLGRRRESMQVNEPYSLAQETYAQELSFDRARVQRRRRTSFLRVLLVIVLVPILLLAAFIASYALTCVLNGASPSELAELMGRLFARMAEFAVAIAPGGAS